MQLKALRGGSCELTGSLLGNRLRVMLNIEEGSQKKLMYAFYLWFNSEKKQVVWYSSKNAATFILEQPGKYRVSCFYRQDGEQPSCFESETILFPPNAGDGSSNSLSVTNIFPASISIMGSCISRDILEIENNAQSALCLKAYIARHSMISAVSSPLVCSEEDVSLSSSFQRRMVVNDFQKKTFDLLKTANSDFLLIDLVDERFPVVAVNDSIITLSNEAVTSGILEKKTYSNHKVLRRTYRWKKYYVGHRKVDHYIQLFVRQIKKHYAEDHIIIHRASLLNTYYGRDGKIHKFPMNHLGNNSFLNRYLQYLYDELESELPNAQKLQLRNRYHADEAHKWGLSPMHYEKKYYEDALEEIVRIIANVSGDSA